MILSLQTTIGQDWQIFNNDPGQSSVLPTIANTAAFVYPQPHLPTKVQGAFVSPDILDWHVQLELQVVLKTHVVNHLILISLSSNVQMTHRVALATHVTAKQKHQDTLEDIVKKR